MKWDESLGNVSHQSSPSKEIRVCGCSFHPFPFYGFRFPEIAVSDPCPVPVFCSTKSGVPVHTVFKHVALRGFKNPRQRPINGRHESLSPKSARQPACRPDGEHIGQRGDQGNGDVEARSRQCLLFAHTVLSSETRREARLGPLPSLFAYGHAPLNKPT